MKFDSVKRIAAQTPLHARAHFCGDIYFHYFHLIAVLAEAGV
jgi:hypothetical protein